MKKFLRLTRLFVCLSAVLTSTSAFANADWVGAGVINVNGTWYYADEHDLNKWASGPFSNATLGDFTTKLELGGQVQLYEKKNDSEGVNWGSNSTAKMLYKFDDATNFTELTLKWKNFSNNNNVYQSGATPNTDNFEAETIDIRSLALGAHTLTVKFVDVDGLKPTAEYTANFTKVAYDISNATVTGVEEPYDWTGSVIHPVLVVKAEGITLESGVDYSVSYENGCINVGEYTITITGDGVKFIGTREVAFKIKNPAGYYVVGSMNGWEPDVNYLLTLNKNTNNEYFIDNVDLTTNNQFKVVYSNNGTDKTIWYPDNNPNYGQNGEITSDGTYSIYFRPNYDGGNDWFYNVIYVTAMTEQSVVSLAPTGYGTYYNGSCQVTLPTGVVAYIVTDATPTYQEIANGDGATKTIPAGTAVLLYSATVKAGGVAANITLTLTPSSANDNYTNLLHGSDTQTMTTDGGNSARYYKLTYGNDNTTFGWYWGAAEGAAFISPANKAWLALPVSNARAFFSLPGDDFTGISTIKNRQQNADNVWYDLNGRRINAPTTKGIYVKDGRKLVIK